ncbi:MAG: hypothetical protein LBS07_02515 [Prevotellaceae bacterium]|jgi:hypothetical protein|nr:hypothetical protein [Prevotellaceae bacterium]
MKKMIAVLSICLFIVQASFAGRELKDITFVERDGVALKMDVYFPKNVLPIRLVLFLYLEAVFLRATNRWKAMSGFVKRCPITVS